MTKPDIEFFFFFQTDKGQALDFYFLSRDKWEHSRRSAVMGTTQGKG